MAYAYLTPPIGDQPFVRAFAHRGGNDVAPENTVAAFRHAQSLGYRYLETDVHRTVDGVLVAFHDTGLARLAESGQTIATTSWSELRTIDLGGGNTIPTLDELLETFPDAHFNIDPKADDSVMLLAAALRRHGALERVCVGSFSDERLETLASLLGPNLCRSPGPRDATVLAAAALAGRNSSRASEYGAMQIPMGAGRLQLNQRMVDGFHGMGLEVHVWTINDEHDMRKLIDLGVDAIMTDRTELLRTVLIDCDRWQAV